MSMKKINFLVKYAVGRNHCVKCEINPFSGDMYLIAFVNELFLSLNFCFSPLFQAEKSNKIWLWYFLLLLRSFIAIPPIFITNYNGAQSIQTSWPFPNRYSITILKDKKNLQLSMIKHFVVKHPRNRTFTLRRPRPNAKKTFSLILF